MHPEADALADLHLHRIDALHTAHQPEAFVAVDECDIEGRALGGMHDGGGVHGAGPLTDAPFQVGAAGKRAKQAGVEHRLARFGAILVGEFALFEVGEISVERRWLTCRHEILILAGNRSLMLAPDSPAKQRRFVSRCAIATIDKARKLRPPTDRASQWSDASRGIEGTRNRRHEE